MSTCPRLTTRPRPALKLEQANADLQNQIADLRKLLLGDYNPAKLSVYDLLAEFEGKLNG